MSFYDALNYCKEQVDKAKAEGKTKVLVPVAEVCKRYGEKTDSTRFRFVLDELSHIFVCSTMKFGTSTEMTMTMFTNICRLKSLGRSDG